MLPNFQFSIFNFQSNLKSKFLKIILLSFFFLLSTFYFLSSAAHIYASSQATPIQSTQYPTPNTNPDVPNNLHNWTQNVMIEVMSSLTCQLAGVDPINPKQGCLGIDQKGGKIGFLQKTGLPAEASAKAGGAIGFMGNMISVLYTPPLHTVDYFQNLASNFGISKKTYAQQTGTGFQSLTPLIGIWSAFRNIVYLFLVIIFVVIGLAIMLRVKIDPRTVMTIQNQIPKIIIGILAVTFSFAIAGFLIDMMWVLIYLIYGIISGIPDVNLGNFNPVSIQGQNALSATGELGGGVGKIAQGVSGSMTYLLGNMLGINQEVGNTFVPFWETISSISKNGITDIRSFSNMFIDIVSGVAGGVAGANWTKIPGATSVFGAAIDVAAKLPFPFSLAANSVDKGIGAVVGYTAYVASETLLRTVIPWFIVYLIIFIALLTALFRLWFTLLMAYVQILLAVVLAPFWIIGGIVPGSPISLSGWLKDISANLLAFPVTIAMFMLGKVFMDAFGETQAQGQFIPPLIGNPGEPKLIGSLIGLGILLMTPNVVNMLKAALKAPKTELGGIGKTIGVATGTLTAPAKPVMTGFSFLAGQQAAKKLPFIGNYLSGK